MILRKWFVFVLCLMISGCSSYEASAPVKDINVHRKGKYLVHRVQPRETLYSVAWRYEMDYRRLAVLNHLQSPYDIYPGELLRLNGSLIYQPKISKNKTQTAHKKTFLARANVPRQKQYYRQPTVKVATVWEPTGKVKGWGWPAHGRVIQKYTLNNKGINIAGNLYDPVYAAAAGKVVYAGNGIRGYGHLLIIKHNDIYLTAYAYNSKALVKEGQRVKEGQEIALMGTTNRGITMLHFEIRKLGKPVNPSYYLS